CYNTLFFSFFFFQCYRDHRDLHSFPTRRSSDLGRQRKESAAPVCYTHFRKTESKLIAAFQNSGRNLVGAAKWMSPSRNWFRDGEDRKSTRLNSSHRTISYAVFCLKKKNKKKKH